MVKVDLKSRNCLLIIIGSFILAAAVAVAIAVPLSIQESSTKEDNLNASIKLLEEFPLIDGHNDWTTAMRYFFNDTISSVDLNDDMRKYYTPSHTDIPRMREGKLGAQFWSCYVTCGAQQKDAVRKSLEQIDVMKRFVKDYPETFEYVTTADEIEASFAKGKIGSIIGVEGGHMIDSSLATLRMLYDMGARYMTLTHSCDTPWADASDGSYPNNGLSEFGKKVVLEMNRLGMLVDLAHVSTEVMRQALDIATAPVIFSHSSVRSLCNVQRNVPDDVIKQMATNGGIIMINFYNGYVTCSKDATVSDVADHFEHVKNLVGVDYIGIGADYDGVPSVPVGLEDVSKYPNLIAELMTRGWTEDELKKIAGQNLLRVMRKVEEVAKQQEDIYPDETWISQQEVANVSCRTLY